MTDPASPETCIATVRTLAIDAVQKANSGHPGAPMGLAPVGWALYSQQMRHAPGGTSAQDIAVMLTFKL